MPTSWLSVDGGPFAAVSDGGAELEFSFLVAMAIESSSPNQKENKFLNSKNVDFATFRHRHEPLAQ